MASREGLEERLLIHGFRSFEGTFASGRQGNNKLEADHETLARDPVLLQDVVELMCEAADPYKPDFFVGVPNGATDLAQRAAREYGAYCINLCKDETKTMGFATEIDRDSLEYLEPGILIEDVLHEGTNTRKTLQLEGLKGKILAGVAVFNRGELAQPKDLDIPVHSLVHRSIPAILPEQHELWGLVA